MSNFKFFEVRDRMTFIPAMAVRVASSHELTRADRLRRRAGYGEGGVIYFTHLQTGETHNDPHDWDTRTMAQAHNYAELNWEKLQDGELIDVRVLLGEEVTPCPSEL